VTAQEMARRLEYWPLERLVPYARNARTHTPAQIAKIAASIREFGFTNPILVDGASGIIAGHARLAAARQLGMSEVPVIELTHLTEDQKRAYILADNRLALEAGWDVEILSGEIAELKAVAFDIALTGFDPQELVSFLAKPAGGPDLPEPPSDRALLRISCNAVDAEAMMEYLKGALRRRGFRGVEITHVSR
jgi:ParB-like chromosome segregation protein Spo0J